MPPSLAATNVVPGGSGICRTALAASTFVDRLPKASV
jgi:hypothetical protein